ncbi:dynamin family protein [Actinomyces mediterranea]|uniref:dynamin family protein n=1 Tax=Actinomyces mediterranea TaxID=1871028 RepID=UPI000970CBF3|nr:dynamin family protein [Actinomyces mediterranea]
MGRGGLDELRRTVGDASFTLPTSSASRALAQRDRILRRLDDFIRPRVDSIDAPLVGVVGGSTGSGKSTIINSLVGSTVSASSAVRPTTRRPLLVHHPDEGEWFSSDRIMPRLTRIDAASGIVESSTQIALLACERLPRGLALVDSPDIDSVSDANRLMSRELLDAADLWVFVTTAARYADAVAWDLLEQAAESGITVAVVLNRIPPGATPTVEGDLRRLLNDRGLQSAQVFSVDEQELSEGLLPPAALAGLTGWYEAIVADANSRHEVARRALTGAIADVAASALDCADALDEAGAARMWALDAARAQIDHSVQRFEEATGDGSLLRGEVLARWQEVVGAADFTRSLSRGFASLRDRFSAWIRGRPAPIAPVEDAIEAGVATLIHVELVSVRRGVEEQWATAVPTRDLIGGVERLSEEEARTTSLILTREWQRALLELVRTQGSSRRSMARIAAIGVNVIAVALIIVLFASTGGLTGGEVGVAGASAVVAQKLLETIFGDQAVRTMTKAAHDDLIHRLVHAEEEALEPLRHALPEAPSSDALRVAVEEVRSQWLNR